MSAPRIRVLHIVRNLNDGGMERVVADLARASDPALFEMHVMALKGFGRFEREVGHKTRLHHAPRMTKFSLLWPAALAAAIRRLAPDVVHTHSGNWYKVAQAARSAAVPLVYTEHGRQHPDPWLTRQLDRRAARCTGRVVAVSHALGRYLLAELRVKPGQLEVITNGVDLGRLEGAVSARQARVPRESAVVFGTLGRIEAVKGYEVLLTAMAEWPAAAPRATLLIAGDGSQRAGLESLARRLGLSDRVRFLGWVDQPDQFYPLLDAFVLSSHSEGTSISLLEAMASCAPPVVTDVGGNRDVLGEQLRDWVVPPSNPAALTAKMVMLARSPELRSRLGAAARTRVEHAYDLASVSRRYAELYRAVVAGARAVPAVRGRHLAENANGDETLPLSETRPVVSRPASRGAGGRATLRASPRAPSGHRDPGSEQHGRQITVPSSAPTIAQPERVVASPSRFPKR